MKLSRIFVCSCEQTVDEAHSPVNLWANGPWKAAAGVNFPCGESALIMCFSKIKRIFE